MFLYLNGITVEAVDEREAEMYKKLGFVDEPAPKLSENTDEPGDQVSIGQIYALCDEAGVKPESLVMQGEHPTLDQVIAAIEVAKANLKVGE